MVDTTVRLIHGFQGIGRTTPSILFNVQLVLISIGGVINLKYNY